MLRLLGSMALVLGAPTPPSTAAPPAPVDTLIDVGHLRLHFRIWRGDGSLAVVFQAGGGASLDAWQDVPARTAARTGATVVAYDRAGMGPSEVGPIDLTPEAELDQLDRALDQLGLRRVVLVGHSFGGLLSLVHAARRPGRVAGLVLVDPMNAGFIHAIGLPWLRHTVPDITSPTTARDTVTYRITHTIAELAERGTAAEAKIGVPAVVITAGIPWWGSNEADRDWRASHATLAERASPGELVVATRSRHDVPSTDPALIVDAVERTLERARLHH
jgi:pimeloyl-ACP methyl ester carboxylesterase